MPSIREQSSAQQRKAYIAHSFDLASDTYDEANGAFFNPVGARLVDLADLRPGDRVLDVGCGRGAVLFAAVAAVGPDGYAAGVDLSPAMVHRTAAQAARAGLRNVSVRVDDAEDLGFPDRSFEAVLSSLALMLTPDPVAALACAYRVLAPGGRFGCASFGADTAPGWPDVLAAIRPFLEPEPEPARPGEVQGRPSGLNALGSDPAPLLTAAGFTDVRTLEETAVTVYPEAQAWWRALWAGGHRAMLETIPTYRREDAMKAAFALLEPLAEDGRLVRRTVVRYTTARRPG